MISIIIPTYNEEKYLPKLLKSIRLQKFKDYEIIVADHNSRDKTVSIAKKYNCQVVKGGRPARARNNGAKIAKGEYLLFLDADVILPRNFLAKVLDEFKKKKIEIAPTLQKPLSEIEMDKTLYEIHNYLLKNFLPIYLLTVGVAILVTKKLHKKISGFNESLNLNEDNDYGMRARRVAKYGAITGTYVLVSMRRLDKQGRFKSAQVAMEQNFYDILKFIGIDKKVKYEFGNFKKKKDLSEIEKFLERILRLIKKRKTTVLPK